MPNNYTSTGLQSEVNHQAGGVKRTEAASPTGDLAIASVASKLKPVLVGRAKEVAETIAAYNREEDEFIAKKLGVSSLEMTAESLDFPGLFGNL